MRKTAHPYYKNNKCFIRHADFIRQLQLRIVIALAQNTDAFSCYILVHNNYLHGSILSQKSSSVYLRKVERSFTHAKQARHGLHLLHGAYPSEINSSLDAFVSIRFFCLICDTLEQEG